MTETSQNMNEEQARKAGAFRALHAAPRIFVMPNAWNAGSACMLEAAGFEAIGTTSAGIAYGLGLPDIEGVLTRDAALAETQRIAAATVLPVSADAQNGYGDSAEAVAEAVCKLVQTGAVGASIEDYSASRGTDLYEPTHAAERIRAAVAAAEASGIDFTITARAECYLVGHPRPFEESVLRANAYREAGAHCLFVPGVRDARTIAALVREIDGPISVVMGLAGAALSVAQLEDLGVRRVSIGGSLARATFGLIRRAAAEIRERGTFGYADEQIPDDELSAFFARRSAGRSTSE